MIISLELKEPLYWTIYLVATASVLLKLNELNVKIAASMGLIVFSVIHESCFFVSEKDRFLFHLMAIVGISNFYYLFLVADGQAAWTFILFMGMAGIMVCPTAVPLKINLNSKI